MTDIDVKLEQAKALAERASKNRQIAEVLKVLVDAFEQPYHQPLLNQVMRVHYFAFTSELLAEALPAMKDAIKALSEEHQP